MTLTAEDESKAAEPEIYLTIIIVTLNAQEAIADTLCSVAAQDQAGLEVLCIDGASRDQTLEVARNYNSSIPGLLILSEPDDSLYAAMNKGLRAARGGYVIFLNAGDFFLDADVVADFKNYLRSWIAEPPSMIYGHTLVEYPNGAREIRRVRSLCYITHGQPTIHQSVFFRTQDHRNVVYQYDAYPISADYAVMAELQLHQGGHSAIWDRTISVFAFKHDSISNRNLRQRLIDAWGVQKRIVASSFFARCVSALRRILAHIYYNMRGWRIGKSL